MSGGPQTGCLADRCAPHGPHCEPGGAAPHPASVGRQIRTAREGPRGRRLQPKSLPELDAGGGRGGQDEDAGQSAQVVSLWGLQNQSPITLCYPRPSWRLRGQAQGHEARRAGKGSGPGLEPHKRLARDCARERSGSWESRWGTGLSPGTAPFSSTCPWVHVPAGPLLFQRVCGAP